MNVRNPEKFISIRDYIAQIERDPEAAAELDAARQWLKELRKRQEPLGKDFKKILYENLWDLYER